MVSNGLPAGWSHEPEDRSVGIFGDAFVHEDCPKAYNPDTTGEATQVWDALTLILTCGDCGAVVELEQAEPDEDPYWGDDLPDRSGEEEMLGRPLFPNEY